MPLRRKLQTVRLLGLDGTAWLGEAFLLSIFVRIGFRIIGVARTQTCLEYWGSEFHPRASPANIDRTIQSAQRAVRLTRRIISGSCLSRSLVLWTLLRRRSVMAELRVGFRRRDGKMEGHSWVELEGVPLNETLESVLTYYPSSAKFTVDAEIEKS
jgi:hypothetical protein